jgi:hypothetical protein
MRRTSRAEGERDSREEAQEDQGASAFALRGYGVTRGIVGDGVSVFAFGLSRRLGSVGRCFGGLVGGGGVPDISVKSALSVVKGLEVV